MGDEGYVEGSWKDGPCLPVMKLPRGTPEGTLEGMYSQQKFWAHDMVLVKVLE